jgi:hypothetical protein
MSTISGSNKRNVSAGIFQNLNIARTVAFT